MSDLLLQLKGLHIATEERTLVQGVDIDVVPGKVTAVVGASGSGKTLSARACMGVVDVVSGLKGGSLRYPQLGDRDWFDGICGAGVGAQRTLRDNMAYLRGGYVTYSPQSAPSALNPGRTIGRQLELAFLRAEKPPTDMGTAVVELLDEVGLPPRAAFAVPSELSGGMAQRAAVAVAVAPSPHIMIADEPETGLDPVLRRIVTELMLQVASHRNVGLMLITHNMDTVERIADTVVKVGEGH